MLNGFDSSLEAKLKQAEEAEQELARLKPLAEEAPHLRLEKAKAQRREERERAKEKSMKKAQRAVETASEKQAKVPELLGSVTRAVKELHAVLSAVDANRREAMQSLAIVDRVDYDVELEEGEEHEISLDRDTRGLAYALAARHGDGRVKRLLDELDPSFNFLRGCNLDEPLYRDVAKFVVERAVSPEIPAKTGNKQA